MKNMNESILDPVQKTRCPEIFDSNDIMHKAVADHIKSAFKLWYEQLNTELKTFDIVGYKMIGSSSGFQYTDTSDIDLQVITIYYIICIFLKFKILKYSYSCRLSIFPKRQKISRLRCSHY